jgi:hypothetical protein
MPNKPKADKGTICPLHRKDVSKVCHTCEWYVQLRGHHPQTGEPIDKWGCSIAFMPLLTIENSQMQRQTGAAVESFRNEMSMQNRQLAAIGPRILSQYHIGGSGVATPSIESYKGVAHQLNAGEIDNDY